MKFIFIISLAAVVFAAFSTPPSKDVVLYIGHREYKSGSIETCIVRPILAVSRKEADSLFLQLSDSIIKKDNGTPSLANYRVWKIEPSMILKKENNDFNRSY